MSQTTEDFSCYVWGFPVKEQIFEQASNTLHHINRAKLFTKNSAVARLQDILGGWGPADPQNILKHPGSPPGRSESQFMGVQESPWCMDMRVFTVALVAVNR